MTCMYTALYSRHRSASVIAPMKFTVFADSKRKKVRIVVKTSQADKYSKHINLPLVCNLLISSPLCTKPLLPRHPTQDPVGFELAPSAAVFT